MIRLITSLTLLLISGLLLFKSLNPDPYWYGSYASLPSKLILWGARAACVMGIILSCLAVASRKIATALALSAAGTLFALWLAYPIAAHYFYSRKAFDLSQFHPYLQLSPPPIAERDPSATHRILFLGGSTTAWPDSTGRGWVRQIEELNQPGAPVRLQTLNQGKEWYTSIHSLINYAVRLRGERADVIVIMHSVNDLLHSADFSYFSRGPFSDDYGHFLGPLARLQAPPTLEALAYDKLRAVFDYSPRTAKADEIFRGAEAFKRTLTSLVQYARFDGARVVLMTEPTLLRESMPDEEKRLLYMVNREAVGQQLLWDVSTAVRGMKKFNDIIREVAKTQNTTLIDLESVVPKSAEYFTDDVHYTDRAHPLIAQHVSKELRSMLAKKVSPQ